MDTRKLTVADVARLTGLSPDTCYRWLREGLIPTAPARPKHKRYGLLTTRDLAMFRLGQKLRVAGYTRDQMAPALAAVDAGWNGQPAEKAGVLLGLRDGFHWVPELLVRAGGQVYEPWTWPNLWSVSTIAQEALADVADWEADRQEAQEVDDGAA